MGTKTSQPQRVLQRTVILVASCLLLGGGLVVVSSLSTVEAGPVQGVSLSVNNTTVDIIQGQMALALTAIFNQTDWSGGPGLVSTTTTTNRYDNGTGVDTVTAGQLSLGYTLAADGSRADLNQDGYLDLVFSNYCSGTVSTNWQYEIDSYIYWGGPDGYTPTHRLGLPTKGASGNAVADLDEDGYLDIVFSNVGRGSGPTPNPEGVNSYIYWGGSQGYSTAYSTTLSTNGSTGCSVADLDGDGNLDIVFSNYIDLHTTPSITWSYEIDSYIYWGDGTRAGYSTRTGLPTKGAVANYVVDLDQDGCLDIVFSNYRNNGSEYTSTTYGIDSYIYWGNCARTGYISTTLPTIGAQGSSVADLNKDGALDIVFSNRNSANGITYTYLISSYIYWGDNSNRRNYTVSNRTELPTIGSYGNSIADLDEDAWPDIIFSNHQSSPLDHLEDSYIYWGQGTGITNTSFSTTPSSGRTGLPTIGAAGNTVGDLDSDGDLDIVFSNRRSGDNHNQNSYIYWGNGTKTGYSSTNRDELSTLGTIGNSTVGSPIASANTTFGVIYAQPITGSTTLADAMVTPHIYAPTGVITSAAFNGGKERGWKKVVWNAAIGAGTGLTIEMATSNNGTDWTWSSVGSSITGTNEITFTNVISGQYLRYRATLQASSDHFSKPTLYDIAFYAEEASGPKILLPIILKNSN